MKRISLFVVFMFCIIVVTVKSDPCISTKQKFEVTYTIKYNSINLNKASQIEEKIRKEYSDACLVEMSIKNEITFKQENADSIWHYLFEKGTAIDTFLFIGNVKLD